MTFSRGSLRLYTSVLGLLLCSSHVIASEAGHPHDWTIHHPHDPHEGHGKTSIKYFPPLDYVPHPVYATFPCLSLPNLMTVLTGIAASHTPYKTTASAPGRQSLAHRTQKATGR